MKQFFNRNLTTIVAVGAALLIALVAVSVLLMVRLSLVSSDLEATQDQQDQL